MLPQQWGHFLENCFLTVAKMKPQTNEGTWSDSSQHRKQSYTPDMALLPTGFTEAGAGGQLLQAIDKKAKI